MSITVNDLKDQTGTPFPRPVLRCSQDGEMYSANKGDYYDLPSGRVLTCVCGQPLKLVIVRTVYEEVKP